MQDNGIRSTPPAFHVGQLRYDFQMACARKASGIVLNVGCNEDPVGLKRRFEDRVINCDMEGWDKHMKRPNVVDRIFNALETPWPFEDDAAELVILGDILEHFPVAESIRVVKEALRVATSVCITVPEDTRIDEAAEHEKWNAGVYNLHTTVVTREKLDEILQGAGAAPIWLVEGPWGFDNIKGFCVLARRAHDVLQEIAKERAEAGSIKVVGPDGEEREIQLGSSSVAEIDLQAVAAEHGAHAAYVDDGVIKLVPSSPTQAAAGATHLPGHPDDYQQPDPPFPNAVLDGTST